MHYAVSDVRLILFWRPLSNPKFFFDAPPPLLNPQTQPPAHK